MLKKIKTIKNIDALDHFNWIGSNLKQFNLIYGWNASGKTTLSRIFNFFERKNIHIEEMCSAEFSVQLEEGTLNQSDINSHSLDIKVFNEDFIKENLDFNDSKARKILIVGKDKIEHLHEIEGLEKGRDEKKTELVNVKKEKSKCSKIDEILTQAGREVTKQFGNTPLANDDYYGRSYNKSNVESWITNSTITKDNLSSLIIDQDVIDSSREVIKSEKNKISLSLPEIEDFSDLFSSANDLLSISVDIQKDNELSSDDQLRGWLEEGYNIHTKRGLKECKFCLNSLTDDRLTHLKGYFTDELRAIKERIDEIIEKLKQNEIKFSDDIDTSELFPTILKNYSDTRKKLKQECAIVNSSIQKILAGLESKKNDIHKSEQSVLSVEYPQTAVGIINESLKKLEELIRQNNLKVDAIDKEVHDASKSIEMHVIASTLLSTEYFKKKDELSVLDAKITLLSNEIKNLNKSIDEKKASLHNVSDAKDQINLILKKLFGDSHIYLDVLDSDENEVGYILKRRGKSTKYFSEGEKSILALAYFLIKLEEDGFDRKNGIIIIDDPVDSQDSILLFRTFGLLKSYLSDVKQLVFLTHNFDFFNLIRHWFNTKGFKKKASFYLIERKKNGNSEGVNIKNLPELLKNYKSEYQYLFSRLYQHDQNVDLLDEPLVANISRKVVEYFSAFKWACTSEDNLYDLIINRFIVEDDDLKKSTGEFIVRFMHEYSHGQEFSRDISASIFEAKETAKNVLNFIKFADEEHFNEMKALCDELLQSPDDKVVSDPKADELIIN